MRNPHVPCNSARHARDEPVVRGAAWCRGSQGGRLTDPSNDPSSAPPARRRLSPPGDAARHAALSRPVTSPAGIEPSSGRPEEDTAGFAAAVGFALAFLRDPAMKTRRAILCRRRQPLARRRRHGLRPSRPHVTSELSEARQPLLRIGGSNRTPEVMGDGPRQPLVAVPPARAGGAASQ